jgi:hypothetical protein
MLVPEGSTADSPAAALMSGTTYGVAAASSAGNQTALIHGVTMRLLLQRAT